MDKLFVDNWRIAMEDKIYEIYENFLRPFNPVCSLIHYNIAPLLSVPIIESQIKDTTSKLNKLK